ncbi:unnamed protein product [Dovyalis caffra]|uniref:Citrate transporter-like domain-containing protein n=1 Tax=Dovyalis caffra TaxID=77055 RepID=A0AAV1RFL6_9ROSI|nr:unnamed protein product [Dovyalis caffra]
MSRHPKGYSGNFLLALNFLAARNVCSAALTAPEEKIYSNVNPFLSPIALSIHFLAAHSDVSFWLNILVELWSDNYFSQGQELSEVEGSAAKCFPSSSFPTHWKDSRFHPWAMLMVVFKVITPEQAYSAIYLSVLGLLFGTIVVGIYLERADMFKYLGILFSWRSWDAKDLPALQNKIRPDPFLLGLASSLSIGSSTTPIGNPQNLIIAIQNGISFWGVRIGTSSGNAWFVKEEKNALDETIPEEDAAVHRISPANIDSSGEIEQKKSIVSEKAATDDMFSEIVEEMKERFTRGGVQGTMEIMTDIGSGPQQSTEERKDQLKRWEEIVTEVVCLPCYCGMLVAFLMGLNLSWTARTAAVIFVVLDFKDSGPCLEKVSYFLLVFFCGTFIRVDGFNRTRITSSLWNLLEPHARNNHAAGIAVLALVILVLSNVASNVPTGQSSFLPNSF